MQKARFGGPFRVAGFDSPSTNQPRFLPAQRVAFVERDRFFAALGGDGRWLLRLLDGRRDGRLGMGDIASRAEDHAFEKRRLRGEEKQAKLGRSR
jgi:hypothetical protein